MKTIPLTKGKTLIVDDDDYELIKNLSWHAIKGGDTYYACTAIPVHRMIMKAPKGMEVDHINGNGLDNRKENLRIVDKSENAWNRKVHSNNSSGIRGVSIDRTYKTGEIWYRAQVNIRTKKYLLGRFKNLEDAIKAREDKVKEMVDSKVLHYPVSR